MTTELEQRARELLAAEHGVEAWGILNLPMEQLRYDLRSALRAVMAALQAQQPGAQAVGYVSPHVIEHLRNGGHSCTTITAHRAMLDDVAIYTQPPSIPEPSEEDVDAAVLAFDGEGHWECFERVIRNDRARLRERIWGGA